MVTHPDIIMDGLPPPRATRGYVGGWSPERMIAALDCGRAGMMLKEAAEELGVRPNALSAALYRHGLREAWRTYRWAHRQGWRA